MSKRKPKTAKQYYQDAHKQMATVRRIFVFDILPGITRPEFEALCRMRPDVYEQFRLLVDRKLNPERFTNLAR